MKSIIENRKFYKRNKILNLIRTREECSIYDIKKLTFYSMATVQMLIGELMECGMIVSEKSGPKGKGRRPFLLHINPDYGCFIGVELHSTQVNCCVIDFQGTILQNSAARVHAGEDREVVLEKMFRLIHEALERVSGTVLGIGVGVPGYFDAANGVNIEYPPIPGWTNIAIRALIEERFGVPCHIENNVATMAMGYHCEHSSAHSRQPMLFVSIRTGIRLVAIIRNELFLCNSGYDGQLGHVCVPGSSRMCLCGKRGCLNTEVADTGLRLKLLEDIAANRQQHLWKACNQNPDLVSTASFVDSVLNSDAEALQLLAETAVILGRALSTVTDLIAPEHIVIYGELSRCGDAFRIPLQDAIAQNAISDNVRRMRLSLCPPDERLGAFGAAQITMQKQFAYLEETV